MRLADLMRFLPLLAGVEIAGLQEIERRAKLRL